MWNIITHSDTSLYGNEKTNVSIEVKIFEASWHTRSAMECRDPSKFKQQQSIEKFFSTMIPGCLDRWGLDIRGLRVKIYGTDKTISLLEPLKLSNNMRNNNRNDGPQQQN